ncbi:LuxR family transcriptional regulator [Paractinoplanes deccanensis]|uniref:LuxR family transcriptional regulator n=1 Tax=Paractinoplanes deccanensis TaxID=113561 RepID=A0ABQ3YAH9_9ACTN|nr:helix-turn-helix transcriptional regulator [Actinoplanes deccanensis]GID77027.1 LuxR family transcriptional regulator [Actinoplanes deccanensis]
MPGEFMLRGRRREQETLDRLVRDVRSGHSRALVLRGEAGAGKTALLDHLAGHAYRAAGCRVARAAGVELESEIVYASLQQLCAPLLAHLDAVPEPQRAALATAFGLSAGRPPEPLILGLATLHLFAEAAAERPLICVVDDAQWLDRMSATILAFVARRLEAESVGLVFAVRTPGADEVVRPDETIRTGGADEANRTRGADQGAAQTLRGLPELVVEGLADADARALLDTVLPGPVDDRVRDRIVAETRGNPLALLELPRGLTATELAFGFTGRREEGLRDEGRRDEGLAARLEEGFQRRIAALPADSRRLLLTAAVEPIGNVPLLWQALERLGIGPEAAAAAESAELIEVGARMRFRHPLVRSAVWRSGHAAELREVHRVLAEVTDPEQDPDRRAWHRAHATVGFDDEVAAELERSAERALSRGGRSAGAAFLERAAELTLDPGRRADLLLRAARSRADAGSPDLVPALLATVELAPLTPLQQAQVERLRARVAFLTNPSPRSVQPLLAAARRLEGLDPAAARETYLMAIGAAMYAGRLGGADDLRRAAESARNLPPSPSFPGRFLAALTTWATDGHAAAAPLLVEALKSMNNREDLGLLWLVAPAAHEVFRVDIARDRAEQAIRFAREIGALSMLPTAMSFRAGNLLMQGRFSDASGMLDECAAVASATTIPTPPSGALALAAYRGREREAVELFEQTRAEARARGQGRLLGLTAYAEAVLRNGLGDYPAALAAAREGVSYPDPAVFQWTLAELVEAAVRAGEPGIAAEARDRLAVRTAAIGNDWARATQALAGALVEPSDELFREAVAGYGSAAMPVLRMRARLLYGEWLRRDNRRTEARAELRAAHEAFSVMGAEAFAERAGRELVATGEAVRTRRAGAPVDLTAQEGQIARLAVAGRTNAEIAATLFLSPRTVEWHLRKVFTKLGIGSRRELAAALKGS